MKKKLFMLLVLILLSVSVYANEKPFWNMSKQETDKKLKSVYETYPDFNDRVRQIAKMRIGTPYVLGPLGENDKRGPVFTLKSADCTVFVLTTLALANRCTYSNAEYMMKYLNYYSPPRTGCKLVSYENRIHFTYDRLHSSKYFKDITPELAAGKTEKAELTLNITSEGTELLPVGWHKRVCAYYIPMKFVDRELLSKIPSSAAGVGFVRKKNFKLGTVIAHEGLITDRKNLIHADSVSGRVVETDFCKYCSDNSDYFDGIIISVFNFPKRER